MYVYYLYSHNNTHPRHLSRIQMSRHLSRIQISTHMCRLRDISHIPDIVHIYLSHNNTHPRHLSRIQMCGLDYVAYATSPTSVTYSMCVYSAIGLVDYVTYSTSPTSFTYIFHTTTHILDISDVFHVCRLRDISHIPDIFHIFHFI